MIHQLRLNSTATVPITAPLRILIPAYNESARISAVLEDYCAYFKDVAVITVIANACTDDTVAVVERLMERFDNLHLMEINARIGKGGAIRAGLKIGDEPYVGFADADGSTSAEEFDRLFNECVQRGAAGVIGSRWLPGAAVSPRQPLVRRFASRAFNRFVRILFGLPFSDTQCGAKIFRRDAVNAVLPSLEVADFAFDIDMLFHMARRGVNVLEVPTCWADRAAGTKIRIVRTSWTMLKTAIRLRLQESFIWRLPFADLLARDSIIPVKGATRILALCESGGDPWALACIRHLESNGFDVQWSESIGHSTLQLLLWYVFSSSRKYDAIVEVAGRRAALIPAISAKQCFLLGKTQGRAFWTRLAYRRLYGRAHTIEPAPGGAVAVSPFFGGQPLDDADPAAAAQYIIENIGAACGQYRAAFRRVNGAWELHLNDSKPVLSHTVK